MNTKEILAKAEEIKKLQRLINNLEDVVKKTWRIRFINGFGDFFWEADEKELIEKIQKVAKEILINKRNKLHEMNGEPLEEIQEQKTNYEKIDTILKEINKDEYENREDKEQLIYDYLKDYKTIREELSQDGFQPLNRNCFIESIKDLIALKNNGLDFEEKYMALEIEIMKFNNATESIRKS